MRVGEVLYLSPKFRFIDSKDWHPREKVIDALEDRIEGYYLAPIRALVKKELAFAAGALAMSAIDFLARIAGYRGNDRVQQWAENNLCLEVYLAKRMEDDFRNGLLHEGRVKNAGQFSFDGPTPVDLLDEKFLRVNPRLLVEEIERFATQLLTKARGGEGAFTKLVARLQGDFGADDAAAIKA